VKNRRTESTPPAEVSLQEALSEQAQQLAIARQQEQIAKQRAAKLDKANEVLKRSLHALALDRQLGTFLGHVLAVLTEQLGGLSSTLWLLDDDKRHFCLHSVCEGGRVVSAEESIHWLTVRIGYQPPIQLGSPSRRSVRSFNTTRLAM